MSTVNFQKKLDLVLRWEGGYVNHPKDPGGATNLGVTQKTLSSWLGRPASIAEVKALTPVKVSPIYKKQYWDKVAGDDLPEGLDYAVFDYAVNSGPSKAIKDLQKVLGVAADGIIGINTLRAVEGRNPADLIVKLCDLRMAFLRRLKTWKTFGKGWERRVNGVRQEALDFHRKGKAVASSPVGLIGAKARPEDEAVLKTSQGQGGALAGLGMVGSAVSEAGQQLAMSGLTDYLEVAQWLFFGLTVVGIGITLYVTFKKARSGDDLGD